MKHYAGLDVSFDETSVCIVDEAGAYVAEAKVASDPAALADYLQSSGLSFGRVGLEACPLSQWLYRSLAAASFPVVCVEVRRVKAALSAMINKTDRNDARGIAQMMRTGWFQRNRLNGPRTRRRFGGPTINGLIVPRADKAGRVESVRHQ